MAEAATPVEEPLEEEPIESDFGDSEGAEAGSCE
jgi:hypothetical protein